MSMKLEFGAPEDVGMDPSRLSFLKELTMRWMNKGAFPGAVYLIARKGVVVAYEALGHAVKTPFTREMRKDTIFDMASLTKVMATATSIMTLVERGYISLKERVIDYFPDAKWRHKQITIWHLLTHTSGLPPFKPVHKLGRDGIIKAILNSEQLVEPGKRVIYSDLGYILLAEIVKEVSKKPLDVYSSENIFIPLGMKDTMFNPPEHLKDRIAATEFCKWRERVLIGEVHDERAYALGGVAGHAGLFSTALDAAIFAQMFLNLGKYDHVRVLSPSTVKKMTKNHTKGMGARRGLGWLLNSRGVTSSGDLLSTKAYGHTGFTGTSLWIDPKLKLIVVLLTNRVHPTRENEMILRFRPLFHNVVAGSILKR
jgi:CubicO group peptidase (beta-lactamase class C family)